MPLTSLRLLVALGVLALLLVVLAARLRRRLPQVGVGLLAFVVLVAGVGAGINRHFDLYRSWSQLGGPTSRDLVEAHTAQGLERATAPTARLVRHGSLLSLRIPPTTSHLHVDGSYVYLPPQYREADHAGESFPVVEAFSGSPGRPADWLDGFDVDAQLDAAINSRQLAPTIVVFPPTNTSVLRSLECTDTADGMKDETYLTVDVPGWVRSHLRTDARPWVAMGYSTGGYCALDLAFRHPDLYDRAISLDGYGHALHDRYARGLWRNAADRLAHSPDWWATHHAPEGVSVYLCAGTDDGDAKHDALRTWDALQRGRWLTSDDRLRAQRHGKHTFDDWAKAFLPAVEWALPGLDVPPRSAVPDLSALGGRQV